MKYILTIIAFTLSHPYSFTQCNTGGVGGNTFIDLHSVSIDPEKNISVGETTRIGFQVNNNNGGTTSDYIPVHDAVITIGFPNTIITANLSTLTLFAGEYGNFEVIPGSIFDGSFKIWNTTNWPTGTGAVLTFEVTGMTVGGSDFNLGLNSNMSISSNCGDINNNQVASGTIYVSEEILPITLYSFDVAKKGEEAVLSWTTVSELGNSHFVIERSTDGQRFQTIGKVDGSGTVSKLQHYTFTDHEPLDGINYYRLRQVDYDGKVSYSNIKNVVFLHINKKIQLVYSPNPVIYNVKIYSNIELINHEISIVDVNGKFIQKQKYTSGMNIDMQNLDKGVYFFNVKDKNGLVVNSTKIIHL